MSGSLPRAIGRYEITKEIGRGMMGVVYEALDPALHRTVALKTFNAALAVAGPEREAFEQRFLTEARVAARLSHPNIVVVHDVGRDPESGVLFMALEHLQGSTLAEATAGGARLAWREALRIAARLADALHAAHTQGVVHRDIKPANIMLLPSGEPKLMDFGIAKVSTSELTVAGQVFGSPSYMSPEQARGEAPGARSDLFSLGTVLYQLLTGRRAFAGESLPQILARVINEDPPLPSAVAPGIPPEVDYVTCRCLSKAPSDRHPDARSLAEDIDDILGDRPPRHRADWRPASVTDSTLVSGSLDHLPELVLEESPPVRPPQRQRYGGALAAAIVIVLASIAYFMPRPVKSPVPSPPGTIKASALPHVSRPAPQETSADAPARLTIDFDHHLKSGAIRVWVDDEAVLEQALTSHVLKKVLSVELRRGTVSAVVDVRPGRHRVRVQVEWDGNVRTETITGSFTPGRSRRLDVSLARVLNELSLEWK